MTADFLDRPFRAAIGPKSLASLVLLATFGVVLSSVAAAALERRSLSDLAKGSELIVDGTVTARTVEALGGGKGARTCFKIAVVEVIAGPNPGRSVRLCFFGGEVNGRGYGVAGMRYPDVGERGIYLIESARQSMLNPLAGWDQGRFLVEKDAATGALKVATADGRRVTALTSEAAQPSPADQAEVMSSAGATAAGVVADDSSDLRGAMSRDEFVARLRAYHGG